MQESQTDSPYIENRYAIQNTPMSFPLQLE